MRSAYAVLTDLDNCTAQPGLQAWRDEVAERLRQTLHAGFVEADPILRGFRDLHDAVKRSNKRFVASAEALIALFQRKSVIPSINPVVDIYNLVSLETRLSLGGHDLAQLQGGVTLRLTRGGERFVPLGSAAAEPIQPGEYCYFDDTGEVLCRLEHRQCERTKVSEQTRGCFLIVQGNSATPGSMIEAALHRVVTRTLQFCGGKEANSVIVT